jgi:parallel beta-helix repeat protein
MVLFIQSNIGVVYAEDNTNDNSSQIQIDETKILDLSQSGNAIHISWKNMNGAESYTLYRRNLDDENSSWYQVATNITECTYTDTGIKGGTTYTYAVRVSYRIESGELVNSSWTLTNLKIKTTLFVEPVSKINVSSNSKGITIWWNSVVSADGYKIFRKTDKEDDYDWIYLSSITETTYKDEDISGGINYIYAVETFTYDNSGSILEGERINSETVLAHPISPYLLIDNTQKHYINLSWNQTKGSNYYNLYRKSTNDTSWEYLATGIKELSYKDTTARPGITYNYAIKAVALDNNGMKVESTFTIAEATGYLGEDNLEYDITEPAFGADGSDTVNDTEAIQNVLDKACLATEDTPLVVNIPAGTYYIDHSLYVYSNTIIKMDERAEIVRKDMKYPMITGSHLDQNGKMCYGSRCNHNGYSQLENVTIMGGTWDGNISSTEDSPTSLFNFAHAQNINISDTALLHCCGSHMINVDAVNKMKVDNVTFSDFLKYTGTDKSYFEEDADENIDRKYYSKEALHFDYITNNGKKSEAYPLENIGCKDITVTNCVFKNCISGIGTHNLFEGLYSDGIDIENNLFDNIANNCINLANFKNVKINYNKVQNTDFFSLLYGTSGTISNNQLTDINTCGIRILNGSNFDVQDNNISISKNNNDTKYGIYIDNANANLVDNELDCRNAEFGVYGESGNIALMQNRIYAEKIGIFLSKFEDESIIIEENSIQNNQYGIFILDGSVDLKIKNNTFKNYQSIENISECIAIKIVSCANGGTICKNTIQRYCTAGLEIVDTDSIMIESNVIEECKAMETKAIPFGIRLNNCNNTNVIGNQIYDNAGQGLEILNSANVNVKNNNINHNLTYGIGAKNVNNILIEDNNILNNNVFDIAVTGDSSGKIINNTIGQTGIFHVDEVEVFNNGRNLEYCKVQKITNQIYTGKEIRPDIILYNGSTKMRNGIDYSVDYKNNVNLGKADVVITGIGSYTGTISEQFEIIMGKPDNIEMNVISTGICVKWNSVEDCNYYKVYRKEDNNNWVSLAKADNSNFSDTTVKIGKTYTYAVKAVIVSAGITIEGVWTQAQSDIVAQHDIPDKPIIKKLRGSSEGVEVSWMPAANAEYYTVYRSMQNSNKWEIVGTNITDCKYVDKSVKRGITYIYAIKGHRKNQQGVVFSSAWSGSDLKINITDELTPKPVINGISASTDGISVSWISFANPNYYILYRSIQNSGKWEIVANNIIGTKYVDNTVKEGNIYTYAIKASYKNDDGKQINSAWSGTELSAKAIDTLPGKPMISSLKAQEDGVKIIWGAVANAEYYTIYRSEKGSDKWTVVKSGVKGNNYTDSSVIAEKVYTYALKSHKRNKFGSIVNSAWSGTDLEVRTLENTLPEKPIIVSLENEVMGIRINWNKVVNAESYTLYRSIVGSGKWELVRSGIDENRYIDTTVQTGNIYTYAIKSHRKMSNGDVLNSAWSSTSIEVLRK